MASKKEISSKMYSTHRCGRCNRFGHHHDEHGPLQVSKEYVGGKWQKVGFYKKGNKMSVKPL